MSSTSQHNIFQQNNNRTCFKCLLVFKSKRTIAVTIPTHSGIEVDTVPCGTMTTATVTAWLNGQMHRERAQ